MLKKETLQAAISKAHEGRLIFGAFRRGSNGWEPTPDCLTTGYSSGERVICGILLAVYFEMNGRPDYVTIPDDREYDDITDLVWKGSWAFVRAFNLLSEPNSWEAIKMLTP